MKVSTQLGSKVLFASETKFSVEPGRFQKYFRDALNEKRQWINLNLPPEGVQIKVDPKNCSMTADIEYPNGNKVTDEYRLNLNHHRSSREGTIDAFLMNSIIAIRNKIEN